mmetsp:Transcript_36416/g.96037  ORF Transcript_36416/g.96037 Transcript_36416/m.96037 type:complete len:335 (+) Transcript_36416:495-1499(+)
MIQTIVLPLFSGRAASCFAAHTDAPDEIPHMSPSVVASSLAVAIASSSETCMTSSNMEISALPGMKPAPMPWILCGPWCLPPESTGDDTGSRATIWHDGFSGLMYCAQPVTVPPVPTPPTRMSISPSVSAQISGPVVSRWIFGLSALLNCWSIRPLAPSSATIISAFLTAPPMPLAAGVRTSLAPSALSMTRRSIDIDSGIVRIRSYPLAAATIARAMPVLPDVGSTIVVTPGVMSPRFSASVIIEYPMRSLTELHGSIDSILASTRASSPSTERPSWSSGVLPISSVIDLAILGLVRRPTMSPSSATICGRVTRFEVGTAGGARKAPAQKSAV